MYVIKSSSFVVNLHLYKYDYFSFKFNHIFIHMFFFLALKCMEDCVIRILFSQFDHYIFISDFNENEINLKTLQSKMPYNYCLFVSFSNDINRTDFATLQIHIHRL